MMAIYRKGTTAYVLHTAVISSLLWLQTGSALRARVGCDNIGSIYIDGQLMYNTSSRTDIWDAEIPNTSSVIAVRCHNTDAQGGGLIASLSNGFGTDIFWRCSDTVGGDWFTKKYDDTVWSQAYIVGSLSGPDTSFPSTANWIWSAQSKRDRKYKSTHCRGMIWSLQALVRCNDMATIYVNGKHRRNTTSHDDVWTGYTPPDPSLIAVRCQNIGGKGGLIILLSNGLVSGVDWKCSDVVNHTWYEVDYDDSSWESAIIVESRSPLPPLANWIWSLGPGSQKPGVTYCRKHLAFVSAIGASNTIADYYVDGHIQGHTQGRGDYWQGSYPAVPALIAVEARNDAGEAGIAVVLSNALTTDATWRCSSVNESGWYRMDFDDTHWNRAHVVHTNADKPFLVNGYYYERLPDFVDWIWDAETSDRQVVRCRGTFGVPYTIQCSRTAKIYVDGVHVGEVADSDIRTSITPRTTRVIAVKCEDIRGDRWISSRFEAFGIQRWKCTNKNPAASWKTIGFDDGGWEDAVVLNEGSGDETVSNTTTRFWTEDQNDGTVYCRWNIECGCDHLCTPAQDGYYFDCSCFDGYTLLNDSRTCQDIDECVQDNGGCKFICYNTPGSHHCGCEAGYALTEDGQACLDVDECVDGACQQNCNNTEGSYSCFCGVGYALSNDSVSCLGMMDRSDNAFPVGVVAGAVAAFAVIIAICIGLFLFIRRKRTQQMVQNSAGSKMEHTYYNVTNGITEISKVEQSGQIQSLDLYEVVDTCEQQSIPDENNVADASDQYATVDECGATDQETTKQEHYTTAAGNDYQYAQVNRPKKKQNHPHTTRVKSGPDSPSIGDLPEQQPSSAGKQVYGSGGDNDTEMGDDGSTKNANPEELSAVGTQAQPHKHVPEIPPIFKAKCASQESRKMADNDAPVHLYGNVEPVELPVSKAIAVSELLAYVRKAKNTGRFLDEFQSIPGGQRGKCYAMTEDGFVDKLRFKNIIPYDHSRVYLTKTDDGPLSDFINASYIDAYRKPKYYIATQGPTKFTVDDFWRMLWEQEVTSIVMVTNLSEGTKEKCYRYWPTDSPLSYGDIKVSVEDRQILPDFTIQSLKAEKDGVTRTIKHFQFTSWPDKGVPEYGSALLSFRRRVKAEHGGRKSPVVVHCSAGVGRTGTYIAIDYLLEQAEAEGVVDAVGCVNLMRENRMDMIQTPEQYTFVYMSVLEAIHLGSTSFPCAEFTQRYQDLRNVKEGTAITRLQDQYEVLDAIAQALPATYLAEAEDKNRSQHIWPIDSRRPRLTPIPGADYDYINAVLVDGSRTKCELVATQMPLVHTRKDMWRLVDDYRIPIIIMLNEVIEGDPDLYFPVEEGGCLDLGIFRVSTKTKSTHESFTKRLLEVSSMTSSEPTKVIHLSIPWWKNSDALPPREGGRLLDVFCEVQKLQKQQQSADVQFLVHCLDGVERCGLFCAMYLMLEKMNAEQEVDIFSAVKRIRISRPLFIKSLEQYKALHDIAEDHIGTFELYANFN